MQAMLKPYASHADQSRGRRHAEPPAPTRDDFQRDRDRVVHSTAFRRLVYKTQVFLNHEGDLFRTRLTHSLEVAQLARSMARSMGLNEDLCEAVSLAHDLGHTPFGHAGQDALDECLRAVEPTCSGFEHNFQSLRVVDVLEERYPDFDGLNLTFEAREGILKHCSRSNALRLQAREPGGIGQRFLDHSRPSLEAQLCNLADETAYNAHDIDDGVRSGLLTLAQLQEVPLFARVRTCVLAHHPMLDGRRLLFEVIRRMLSMWVYDIVDTSNALLQQYTPRSADDARNMPPLICMSPGMSADCTQLKQFLRERLYRHPQVVATTGLAKQVVGDLFAAYRAAPGQMPAPFQASAVSPRGTCDYIAGMTDRFALREHFRMTGCRIFA